jgi:hypothetical protein
VKHAITLVIVLAGLLVPRVSGAQTLGTFHWRLLPYCNTLTLTVIQDAGGYRLQGYEDLCENVYFPQPVSGTAIIDSEGRVIIGLTTTISGGFSFKSTRISARLDLPSLSGGWNDDAGR